MSAAYERVRAALKGTALESEIDRLNAELHLTPESPEWTLAALGIVGGAALQSCLEHAELSIVEALGNFPEALRASAIPIVEALAGDIRRLTVAGVREDAKRAIIDILTRGIDAHAKVITDLSTEQNAAAKSLTSAAAKVVADSCACVSQIDVRAMNAASAYALSTQRLTGWSPARIASVALGTLLLAASFAIGLSWSTAHDALTCSARIGAISSAYRLSARQADLLHHQICGS